MYNSFQTEKHRSAFSKGNLKHPSKAFVDFMINDQTSIEQVNRVREEGYTSNDMRRYLFHLKDEGWIKEFQWNKQQKHWNLSFFLFRLRYTSESHYICAGFNLGFEKRSKKANSTGQKGLQGKEK